jgi:hypothetical protein
VLAAKNTSVAALFTAAKSGRIVRFPQTYGDAMSPYREFARQFGGKPVLAGLRLKKQLMVVSKITFEV